MVNGFHEKALLTASLPSAFRPPDKMDALFFPHKRFHSARPRTWDAGHGPTLTPGCPAPWALLEMATGAKAAKYETRRNAVYLLEFCKQLIWPCPLDEPGLIRILFVFQGLLTNRKLSASEQSSSCLPRACRLLPLAKERCSSFHVFGVFFFCINPCELPYK